MIFIKYVMQTVNLERHMFTETKPDGSEYHNKRGGNRKKDSIIQAEHKQSRARNYYH